MAAGNWQGGSARCGEIPGRGYATDRVYDEGAGSWIVSLDLQIEETVLGQPVKTRLAAYPVRVVRYDVDRELNPWGLALDCLADVPRVIELGNRREVSP